MQKINLEGLNEYVAYEKLDNNLDVYVYRKKDFHSFYAYYITCTQKISSKIDLFELLFFPNELKLGGVQNATNYEKN